MANLTDQDNIILWDKLEGVKKFEHDFPTVISGFHKEPKIHGKCRRCDESAESVSHEFCPIPDPYPGSEADIAEKIRQWLGKDSNMKHQADYFHILHDKYKDMRFELSYALWLLVECTPADKIQAFIAVFKGDSK